jgi:hypothetical protein
MKALGFGARLVFVGRPFGFAAEVGGAMFYGWRMP